MAELDLSTPIQDQSNLPPPATFSRAGAVTEPEDDPGEAGGFTDRDAARPRLQLLQPLSKPVGDRPELMGKWVVGNPAVLLGTEVELVIASVQKVYVEDGAKGAGAEAPKTWFSVADARASGLKFRDGAVAVAFVKVGDEAGDLGPREVGDELWVPCDYWATSKSGYRVVVDNLSRLAIGKSSGRFGGVWRGGRLRYKVKKLDNKGPQGGYYFVPEFVGIEKTEPELLKMIEESGLARTPKA